MKVLEILTDISEQVCEPTTCNAGQFQGLEFVHNELCTEGIFWQGFLAAKQRRIDVEWFS